MARRIKLHIDKFVHFNDVLFEVYRSTEPGVDKDSTHIMTIDDKLAIKQTYTETTEILSRDPYTPYAFLVKRHFETTPFPTVHIGSTAVLPGDIQLFPDDKTIEIHNGDLGLFDGRTIYADYEYQAIPVVDDTRPESGKTYMGTPATGLRPPINFKFEQDVPNKKIHLTFERDTTPVTYFYKIYARDSHGNLSPWSDELYMAIEPSEVFFRIERSKDGKEWEEMSYSNMMEWFDEIHAVDNPKNLTHIETIPIDSKEARITFDNPWYTYTKEPRISYQYRVRAEDSEGYFTDWIYFGPIDIFIEPKEILIRRKLDNGTVSSKEGIDAIDVFKLTKADVDITKPQIMLTDDQLTDASKYAYTFFVHDELDLEAAPVYSVSDHTPWANVILFKAQQYNEDITTKDFVTSFELADRIIEIGGE